MSIFDALSGHVSPINLCFANWSTWWQHSSCCCPTSCAFCGSHQFWAPAKGTFIDNHDTYQLAIVGRTSWAWRFASPQMRHTLKLTYVYCCLTMERWVSAFSLEVDLKRPCYPWRPLKVGGCFGNNDQARLQTRTKMDSLCAVICRVFSTFTVFIFQGVVLFALLMSKFHTIHFVSASLFALCSPFFSKFQTGNFVFVILCLVLFVLRFLCLLFLLARLCAATRWSWPIQASRASSIGTTSGVSEAERNSTEGLGRFGEQKWLQFQPKAFQGEKFHNFTNLTSLISFLIAIDSVQTSSVIEILPTYNTMCALPLGRAVPSWKSLQKQSTLRCQMRAPYVREKLSELCWGHREAKILHQ